MHARVCERVHLVYNQRGYVIYLFFPGFFPPLPIFCVYLREKTFYWVEFFCVLHENSQEQVSFDLTNRLISLPRVL